MTKKWNSLVYGLPKHQKTKIDVDDNCICVFVRYFFLFSSSFWVLVLRVQRSAQGFQRNYLWRTLAIFAEHSASIPCRSLKCHVRQCLTFLDHSISYIWDRLYSIGYMKRLNIGTVFRILHLNVLEFLSAVYPVGVLENDKTRRGQWTIFVENSSNLPSVSFQVLSHFFLKKKVLFSESL